jgi:mannose-6-phosphate isomerase
LAHQVEKPWGRTQIPSIFGDTDGRRIGEIWFEPRDAAELPLLIKYIFTNEKLSVQVHPDDEQARERGLPRGKSECWYILDAEPTATLGLGLRESISPEELRRAALDGSIELLMDWMPVSAGDFFFVPPGTIHAIGPGIALIEFQQKADVTYRLYDYGRPRELHLDDAVAVATAASYPRDYAIRCTGAANAILLNGPHFNVVRVSGESEILRSVVDRRRWVAPLQGFVFADQERASAGECLLIDAGVPMSVSPSGVALCASEGLICG